MSLGNNRQQVMENLKSNICRTVQEILLIELSAPAKSSSRFSLVEINKNVEKTLIGNKCRTTIILIKISTP